MYMCCNASLVLLCMKQPRCIDSLQSFLHLSHAQFCQQTQSSWCGVCLCPVPQRVAYLTRPTHMAAIRIKDVDIDVMDLEIG